MGLYYDLWIKKILSDEYRLSSFNDMLTLLVGQAISTFICCYLSVVIIFVCLCKISKLCDAAPGLLLWVTMNLTMLLAV